VGLGEGLHGPGKIWYGIGESWYEPGDLVLARAELI